MLFNVQNVLYSFYNIINYDKVAQLKDSFDTLFLLNFFLKTYLDDSY